MDSWAEIRHQVTIAGRLTDPEDGDPIAGAQICITAAPAAFADALALKALAYGRGWDHLTVRFDRALTAADGRFQFVDLPDGNYTVTAERVGQGNRYGIATANVTVARGSDGAVKLAMADLALPPTRVTGKVSIKGNAGGANDVPVAMAQVRLRGGGESTFTDGQGFYVLSGIEPGERIVRVQANGLAAVEASVTLSGRGQSVTANFSFP